MGRDEGVDMVVYNIEPAPCTFCHMDTRWSMPSRIKHDGEASGLIPLCMRCAWMIHDGFELFIKNDREERGTFDLEDHVKYLDTLSDARD
ncbi:MAG: hypothetical protein OXK17_00800 [Thaumarchaeota archaeon]|nr:hypothetical protein [Nitrososphaerota archaeon]